RDYVTTREVLEAERRMIAYARDGRGTRLPIARGEHRFGRDWLNDQQRRAVLHVLRSKDAVTAISGGAGTGKSSTLEETAEGIAASWSVSLSRSFRSESHSCGEMSRTLSISPTCL
ncbi:MAG: AAA family ATPase, partial [Planctomycetota bacterium]